MTLADILDVFKFRPATHTSVRIARSPLQKSGHRRVSVQYIEKMGLTALIVWLTKPSLRSWARRNSPQTL